MKSEIRFFLLLGLGKDCYNLEGTYKCICKSGFESAIPENIDDMDVILESDLESCVDIDECKVTCQVMFFLLYTDKLNSTRDSVKSAQTQLDLSSVPASQASSLMIMVNVQFFVKNNAEHG